MAYFRNVKIRIRSHMTDLVLDDINRENAAKENRKAQLRRFFERFGENGENTAPDDETDTVVDNFFRESVPEKLSYEDLLENIGDEDREIDEDIEYTSDGTVTVDGGRITVSYCESAMLGMENAMTSLSFAEGQPGLVTMVRSGMGAMSISFDINNRRQICQYDTGFAKMELCVITRAVKNDITVDGGRMILDYFIEIRGLKTEHTFFEMEVTPAPVNTDDSLPEERCDESSLLVLLEHQRAERRGKFGKAKNDSSPDVSEDDGEK